MLASPLLYANMPDSEDVTGLSDADVPCLEELRDVLKKYGFLNRFGIALLHKHFPLEENEVLVETCDVEKRELLLRPVKVEDAQEFSALETMWCLTDGRVLAKCRIECVFVDGEHSNKHVTR